MFSVYLTICNFSYFRLGFEGWIWVLIASVSDLCILFTFNTCITIKIWAIGHIMQTCPCNVYPLTPHFYIVKLGFTGVYIFSYFCSKT